MANYVTTDRAAFNAQVTAKLAAYGAAWLTVGPSWDDAEPCVVGDILDLQLVAGELNQVQNPASGSPEEGRAALFVGYLIRRHGLGALPVPVGTLPVVVVAGAGGLVTWDTLPGKPNNLVYGPLTSSDITNFTAAVQAIIGSNPPGVSAHSALTGVVIVGRKSEGGVDPATLPAGTAVHFTPALAAALRDSDQPFIQPTASLTLSPSGLQRLGDLVSLTVDGDYSVGSDSAPTQGVYRKNGVAFATQTTGIGAAVSSSATSTATFSFLVTFPTSGVKTANRTITFAAPTYRGVAAPAATDAQILALTEDVSIHGTSVTLTFPAGAVGQVYHFAFPASWGLPSVIKDSTGFPVTSGWNVSSGSHTGGFANGDYADTYRFIRSTTPLASAAGAQTFTFIW